MNASLSTIVPSDFGFPKLVVQKISGLSETSTTIDGVIKKLLVAVKNTNFIIYLGVEMSPNSFLTSDDPNYMALNFSAISLEIRLVYDSPDEKEVDFLHKRPFQYNLELNESATQAIIKGNISVLTSQHEYMNFILCFRGYNMDNKNPYKNPICRSVPIRVISKPERTGKKKKQMKAAQTLNSLFLDNLQSLKRREERLEHTLNSILISMGTLNFHPPASSSSSSSSFHSQSSMNPPAHFSSSSSSSSSPSAYPAMLAEPPHLSLDYQNHRHMIDQRDKKSLSAQIPPIESATDHSDLPVGKKQKTHEVEFPVDFDTALNKLLLAMGAMSTEERARQIQMVIQWRKIPGEEIDQLHDILCSALGIEIGQEDCPDCIETLWRISTMFE